MLAGQEEARLRPSAALGLSKPAPVGLAQGLPGRFAAVALRCIHHRRLCRGALGAVLVHTHRFDRCDLVEALVGWTLSMTLAHATNTLRNFTNVQDVESRRGTCRWPTGLRSHATSEVEFVQLWPNPLHRLLHPRPPVLSRQWRPDSRLPVQYHEITCINGCLSRVA